jgi:hypothetical protein
MNRGSRLMSTTVDQPAAGIFACALRDDLLRRARAGDARALEMLLDAVPQDLPSTVRRVARDDRIRALGAELAAMIPGLSASRCAKLLSAAGGSLDRGRRTAGRELPMLTTAELEQVESEISAILSWLPPRHDGRRWPARRQMHVILTG